ncbi:hypothetical protein [Caudoviricetes sp.]|nr:hypothetical protein [Caudoviricetes sp.]
MATIKFSDFASNPPVPTTYMVGYESAGTFSNTRFSFTDLQSALGIAGGTLGYFWQGSGGSTPSWFNLFGSANTFTGANIFTTVQTVQGSVSRRMLLDSVTSSGYASGTTISASAANQPVTVTNGKGLILTLNESVNTNSFFPLFTFANRSLGGYVATVPQWQLRMKSVGTGATGCRIIEITIPSSNAYTASQVAERWDMFETTSSYAFKQTYLRASFSSTDLNPSSAFVHLGAATTSIASLNIKTSAGTAPSSPADGDIWYDGTNLKMRVGAITKTFTLV